MFAIPLLCIRACRANDVVRAAPHSPLSPLVASAFAVAGCEWGALRTTPNELFLAAVYYLTFYLSSSVAWSTHIILILRHILTPIQASKCGYRTIG